MNLKELIKEFTDKQCSKCNSYVVCGGEVSLCKHFEKFLKEKGKQN